MFAPTYIAAAVAVAVNLLKMAGIEVGSEELTTTVTTIITVVSGLVIMFRQLASGRSTLGGLRK